MRTTHDGDRMTEDEARVACQQTERERRRRLEDHGADFCRKILDGAFERVYQTDGSYRLREASTGAWIEERLYNDAKPPVAAPAPTSLEAAAADPARGSSDIAILVARQYGYRAALRDVARWISMAAIEPRMHADTLSALNAQITALAGRSASAATDVEPG